MSKPSTSRVPEQFLRPVPVGAAELPELMASIDALLPGLPGTLPAIDEALRPYAAEICYDAAANRALEGVWPNLYAHLSGDVATRRALLDFATRHMPVSGQTRVLRLLSRDPDLGIRGRVRTQVRRRAPQEVSLPASPGGEWSPEGWQRGQEPGALHSHKGGTRVQKQLGVPQLTDVAGMRGLLGIASPKHLGWLLRATDGDDGPYHCFTIPKQRGGERLICAPQSHLRRVQRTLLEEILAPVPVHPAAHGFVVGRSVVTNAAAHQGAEVILKFDLKDFFPTLHYFRVVGLFASLGYPLVDARFSTDDNSTELAATLARLCIYVPQGGSWGSAWAPQGAPTSPAISNLVCRGLDHRLERLAAKVGGTYTRYADDMTFSFGKDAPDLGRFRWWVDQIVHQEGFLVRQDKFRVVRRSQRQQITGVVINNGLRIPREERRRFRAILHNCEQHGLASQARDRPRFEAYLMGFASYIHMIHPEEGAELLQRVKTLVRASQSGPAEDVPF